MARYEPYVLTAARHVELKPVRAGLIAAGSDSDFNARGNRARGEGQRGWSGTQVEALAQQTREVMRILEELGGETRRAER